MTPFSPDSPVSAHVSPRVDAALHGALLRLLSAPLSVHAASLPSPLPPLLCRGTYAHTLGPRFETAAEIRFLAGPCGGTVVGMTAAHELTLAAEHPALPVAALCVVDNMANGVGEHGIHYASFKEQVALNLPTVEAIFSAIVTHGLTRYMQ